MKEIAFSIVQDLQWAIRQVDDCALADLAEELFQARRVFLAGVGRGDFISRLFATRLTQLGKTAHVVRDATTPAIGKDDLLLVFPSLTENKWLADLAKKAYRLSVDIAAFSPASSSPLADLCGVCVLIPVLGDRPAASLQSSAALFDQAMLVLCDMLAIHLNSRSPLPTGEQSRNRANLE